MLDTLENHGAFNIKYRQVSGQNQCKLDGDVTDLLVHKLIAPAPAEESKAGGQYFRQGVVETCLVYEQLREPEAGPQTRLISTDSEPERVENKSAGSEAGLNLEHRDLGVVDEQGVFDPAKVDTAPEQVPVEQIVSWQCGDRVIGFWTKERVWRMAVVLQVTKVNFLRI